MNRNAYIVLNVNVKERKIIHAHITSAPAIQLTNMGNGTIHTQYGDAFPGESYEDARNNALQFLKTYVKDLYELVVAQDG